MLRAILAALLVCLPCFATTTYYVDPVSGSNSNAGTSFAAAWKTTQKALDTAVADDEVRLCQTGTETTATQIDADTNTGAAATPIKFYSYNSTGTTLTSGYTIQASGAITSLLKITPTANYVMFVGVIFDGNSNATYCIYNDTDTSSYNKFRQCDIKGATSHGVNVRGTAAWYFNDCLIHNNGGKGLAKVTANRGRFVALGCKVYSNGSDGIEVNANNDNISNCIVYNNGGIGISWGTSGSISFVMYCTIYGNTSHGMDFYNSTTRNEYICVGNTLVNNGGYGLYIPTTDPDTFTFLNFNHTYNNTSGASNITLPGTNQTGDPKFANAGSGDFKPTAGSPLLGNGPNGTTIGALGMTAGGSTVIVIED